MPGVRDDGGGAGTLRAREHRRPVEHARTACPRGHHFLLSIETLTRPPLPTPGRPLRIMLLCSAFNGLTQRAWIELRAAGHEVTRAAGRRRRRGPGGGDGDRPRPGDLPVPARTRTRRGVDVTPHDRDPPGPKGDRGPSSLDWAIMDAEPVWGVTALQAVEEMDAGPIWASRTFPVDAGRPEQERALQRAGHRHRASH